MFELKHSRHKALKTRLNYYFNAKCLIYFIPFKQKKGAQFPRIKSRKILLHLFVYHLECTHSEKYYYHILKKGGKNTDTGRF